MGCALFVVGLDNTTHHPCFLGLASNSSHNGTFEEGGFSHKPGGFSKSPCQK